MANKKYDKEEGVWRTIGGRRVFIKTGVSLSQAMRDSGKFKRKGYKNEEYQKQEDNIAQLKREYNALLDEEIDYQKDWDMSEDPSPELEMTAWEREAKEEALREAQNRYREMEKNPYVERKYGVNKQELNNLKHPKGLKTYDSVDDVINDPNSALNRYINEKGANDKGIDDLYNLAQSKYNKDTHSSYLEHNKIREDYLKNYDRYKNPERNKKIEADDIWSMGYKETMYDQFENAINNPGDSGDYNTMKAQDTLAVIKKEAEYSLHNKYLNAGGKISEAYDRKSYGDEKVDAALMREQEFLRHGFTNISTELSPKGMVNDFDYSDMIIRGDKDGVQVTFNYNAKGDSAVSLRGYNNGGYGELLITDKNVNLVRDITARGSVGSPFRETMPYSAYKTKKLTIPESKEYYKKANEFYKENKDAHYYDSKFFNDYNEKLKDKIISKRNSAIREEYLEYMREHPNSNMDIDTFKKNIEWYRKRK